MSIKSLSGRIIYRTGPDNTGIIKPPERFTLGIRESEPTLTPSTEYGNLFEWTGVSQCFNELTRLPRDLCSALEVMRLPRAALIAAECQKRASELLSRGVRPGTCTPDDLAVILAYLREPSEDGEVTPFRALTESLTNKRSRASLRGTCEFFYLLTRSFHKLPRYYPESSTLYCGVRGRNEILVDADPTRPKVIPYSLSNVKMWLPFITTSIRYDIVKDYLLTPVKDAPPGTMTYDGTIFMISGPKTWGYNVSAFSDYPDEWEVVLEPERGMLVSGPLMVDGPINVVTLEMIDSPPLSEAFTPRVPLPYYPPQSAAAEAAESAAAEGGGQMALQQQSLLQQPGSGVGDSGSGSSGAGGAGTSGVPALGRSDSSSNMMGSAGGTGGTGAAGTGVGHQRTQSIIAAANPLMSSQSSGRKGEQAKKIKIKEVPERLTASDITCTGIKLSWTAVRIPGKEVNYQVEMKKKGLFNRNNENVYEGPSTTFEKSGLEPETEYEFQVRLGYDGAWGRWSDKIEVVTIKYPDNIRQESSTWSTVTLTWTPIPTRAGKVVSYKVELHPGTGEWKCVYEGKEPRCVADKLLPDATYWFHVRSECDGDKVSGWSKNFTTRTDKTSAYTASWAPCPDTVEGKRRYGIEGNFSCIAKKINENHLCTILGREPIPTGSAVSWTIKILASRANNAKYFFVGVAPSDLDQNDGYNVKKDGWYFHCFSHTLWSGPPHCYRDRMYSTTKKGVQVNAIGTGQDVGIVLDTSSKSMGVLSYMHKGCNLGYAYEGIPLDYPLVPAVILFWLEDTIELKH